MAGFKGYKKTQKLNGDELFVVEQDFTKAITANSLIEYIQNNITLDITSLDRVNLRYNPNDGDIIKWDKSKEEWISAPLDTVVSLNSLSDVNVVRPNEGDALRWNDADKKWTLGSVSSVRSVSDLSDVELNITPDDGQVLKWRNDIGKFTPSNTMERFVLDFVAKGDEKVVRTPSRFDDISQVDVWIEGIKLIRGDEYFACDRNTAIQFTQPLDSDDNVEIHVIH